MTVCEPADLRPDADWTAEEWGFEIRAASDALAALGTMVTHASVW
ncbi:hypothetical protein [Amycolatopsis sp. lyj-108]